MKVPPHHKEDRRLECITADGGGDHATYRYPRYTNCLVEYTMYDENGNFSEYPWVVCPVVNGRMISGIFYAYAWAKDAVDAIEDGSWKT